MEIVTGALPTVLTKLGDLLVGEYNLHKRLKGEIRVLEAELRSMQGALEKVSSTPADQVDSQDKIWASDVRELFYDIEDSIDTFLVHRHSKGSELHGFDKFLDRSSKLWTRFRVGRKIATEIRDIRRRVVEVAEQRDRYKIQTDATHKPVTIDTRIFARYKNVTDLVGIDEERDAVINILMEGNGVSKQQDNIVSIVGFGGLGKTTLANVVYEKLRGQFDCSAFVSVSQRPDMDKLFMDMFRQLGKETNNASIDAIRGFLLEKRYEHITIHTSSMNFYFFFYEDRFV
jgi:ATPase subunit of ABC transporter with duplicated ATPase domains